ncbi:hypothetical protein YASMINEVIRUS_1585 [Yasminevirus sp. GU-2018]|uniref:Cell division cycle protein 123 n=1 Tax=Yasminevirus sp. GU-2018 TaxID=2420051 RepID=A0A5K0UBM1_9VIRU|nr:hypothetical protein YASMINEVIRUS_1585 [Yasminevirus sp. GU-2018]
MSRCKVEEYNHDTFFRYVLSSDEKKVMSDIAYDVINKCHSDTESRKLVESKRDEYQHVFDTVKNFFDEHPGSYFLRLSTLSPKDAYDYLNRPAEEESTEDSESNASSEDEFNETSKEIAERINVLKVCSADQTFQVLLHSYRVFCDLESDCAGDNAILLMKWREIQHDTETRCYVKDRKLLAISQYYIDCSDSYGKIESMHTFYRDVVSFVNELVKSKEKVPYDDVVIDLCMCKEEGDKNDSKLEMIEMNPFDRNTDSGMFAWDEIEALASSLSNVTPSFRFSRNGKTINYTS